MGASKGRMAVPSLSFNGADVTRRLKDCLKSVTYTDVAEGGSDSLSIRLENASGKWLSKWYPQKGNAIGGSVRLKRWGKDGKDKKLEFGTFTLDDARFGFGPMELELSGTSAPAASAFSTRERNKTWKKVTVEEIAIRICERYGMTLSYAGGAHKVKALEQSENDGAFLKKLCEDYGLSMKIYMDKVVIYDLCELEEADAVRSFAITDFPQGDLSITDGLYGTYTGARVSYKPEDGEDEISVFVGTKEEGDKKRVLKVNEACDSEAEARRKGAAKVNEANRKAVTLSGSIFPDAKVCAGACIELKKDFGRLAGKYFVDKSTWTIDASGGTKQKIDAHKVQERVA